MREAEMTDSTQIGRRQLLGGAALAAAAAGSALAQGQGSVAGRSVLITGCSSGFGRLTALHLAREGANVIASMRNLQGGRRKEAQELRDLAAKDRLKLALVEIDVTSDAQVAAGVREAERIAGGGLDVLVNNAGIGLSGPVELQDVEATQDIFDTNLYGYLRMARAALPAMRARKQGLVVNVSSQLGRVVLPGVGHYAATKFGVEAISETLAYELAPFGVEVTIVQPGGYPTEIWANGRRYSDAALARAEELRRAAYAQHVATAQRMFGGGGGSTDPMDVPRAIAAVMALPPGSRPLRRPVHTNSKATEAVNAAMAHVQAMVLGSGPFAPWHKAVVS
jgi:NAD(P)-dependent dehydrogenase (short-subunit alcohol dehydrogenase family)